MHAADITRCPVALAILDGRTPAGGCSTIVRSQSPDDFQLPEPWSGHIDRAPILFLTTNPSISHDGPHPRRDWPDERIVNFYRDRFDGRTPGQIRDGKYVVRSDGTPRPTVQRTWAELLSRASELVDAPRPGLDYALTEVVRCKSKQSLGVREAFAECVDRWLRPVLEGSAATVVVACGATPRMALARLLGTDLASGAAHFATIGGRAIALLAIGAPGSAEPRRIPALLMPETLARLRRMVAEARP